MVTILQMRKMRSQSWVGRQQAWVRIWALHSGWVTLVSSFTSEDLCHWSVMKTLPIKPHTQRLVIVISIEQTLNLSSWFLLGSPAQCSLGTQGSARMVLGQGRGSGEVTPEPTLGLGIPTLDPTERQECGLELAEGHPEGWPGLFLAAHKCPGGMGWGGAGRVSIVSAPAWPEGVLPL